MDRIGKGRHAAIKISSWRINVEKLNVSSLKKGDYLPPEQVSEIIEVKMDDPMFHLEVAKLQDYIMRQRQDMDSPIIVKCEGLGLRVLTDSEAVEYNATTRRHGIRKLNRAQGRDSGIDRNNLTDGEVQKLERNMEFGSRVLSSIRSIKRTFSIPKYERQTPGRDVGDVLTGTE